MTLISNQVDHNGRGLKCGFAKRKIQNRAQMLFKLGGNGAFNAEVATIVRSGCHFVDQNLTFSIQKKLYIEKATLLDQMADSVFVPYVVMAVVLFVLGLLMRLAPLPHVEAVEEDSQMKEINTQKSIFQYPHLWLGMLTLFVYVGAEVIAGDTIIAYGIALGISATKAKFFTSYTLMAMVAAYVLGVVLIPKYLSQKKALQISALLGIICSVCILLTDGNTSVLFVAALGIANALVWPAVWPLTLEGLGKHTKTASALLIMAISGGAIIPPLYGRLVDQAKDALVLAGTDTSVALATAAKDSYFILIPCYVIIFLFALWGDRLKSNKT